MMTRLLRESITWTAGAVEIAAHLVYELDADGKRLQVKKFTEYTRDSVRSMYPSAADLRARWSNTEERAAIIAALEGKGISFEELAEVSQQADADPFDLPVPRGIQRPDPKPAGASWPRRKANGKAFFDKFAQRRARRPRRIAREVRRVRHGAVPDT